MTLFEALKFAWSKGLEVHTFPNRITVTIHLTQKGERPEDTYHRTFSIATKEIGLGIATEEYIADILVREVQKFPNVQSTNSNKLPEA